MQIKRACAHRNNLCTLRRSRLHCANRGSAALWGVRFALNYQNHNLSRHEVPLAVEHPRETENPPGTPSGRRLRLEIAPSPVERLFPPSGGVSRGSVRVGGETFLLPSYGFSFGYKRKGVSIAPPTEAQRNIVGQKMRVNAITGRRYNPSVFSAFIVRGRQVCGTGTPGCPMAACRIRRGCPPLCPPQAHAGTLRRRRRRFR